MTLLEGRVGLEAFGISENVMGVGSDSVFNIFRNSGAHVYHKTHVE